MPLLTSHNKGRFHVQPFLRELRSAASKADVQIVSVDSKQAWFSSHVTYQVRGNQKRINNFLRQRHVKVPSPALS
jgi:hypothetical protein